MPCWANLNGPRRELNVTLAKAMNPPASPLEPDELGTAPLVWLAACVFIVSAGCGACWR